MPIDTLPLAESELITEPAVAFIAYLHKSVLSGVSIDLFGPAALLPPGMLYDEGFLSATEEAELLGEIAHLPLEEAQYKQYTARRRIVAFGSRYDFGFNELHPAPPVPEFLLPLRERVAAKTGIAADRFADVLVTEYRPGTPLGWHRDVPQFEVVVGVSLASACRMRFRRYPHRKHSGEKRLEIVLEPRSIYVLQGQSRWDWQHSVPPTQGLRYSITFRTRRAERSAAPSGGLRL
jgi:alkylated DNA repair dioxygenase AlkB